MRPVRYKDLINPKILEMKIDDSVLNGLKPDDRLNQIWLNVFIQVGESYQVMDQVESQVWDNRL